MDEVRYSSSSSSSSDTEQEETEESRDVSQASEEQVSREQRQRKHDSDYFSFFKSHENIILKPESNFKGLRTFLTHLPIDYYILLQEGYNDRSRDSSSFEPSQYIYCDNIPLLHLKKTTYFKKSSPVRTIALEDVYKCSSRYEAEQLLEDPYAVTEMIRHLSERYGEIEEQFFVNYDVEGILARVGMAPRDGETLAIKSNIDKEMEETTSRAAAKKAKTRGDITTDTENFLEVDNFESLMMKIDSNDVSAEQETFDDGKAFTQDEIFDHKRQAKLQTETREIERSHL